MAAGLQGRLIALLGPSTEATSTTASATTAVTTPPEWNAVLTVRGVTALDDLVPLLTRLLEKIDDPLDLERALDGVSRLCDRSDATLRSIQPLARRAAQIQRRMTARPFTGVSPRLDLAGLIGVWASGHLADTSSSSNGDIHGSIARFLSRRVFEVAQRAAQARQQLLLALPTELGRAINSRVLAERRAQLDQPADQGDTLQAALRAGEVEAQQTFRFSWSSRLRSHVVNGKTYTHVEFSIATDPPITTVRATSDIPGLFAAAVGVREADSGTRAISSNRC